jgi:Fe-Mn family superoxide dismutase
MLMDDYELIKLPYAYDALEPHIDAKTMEVHYSKHYAGYLENLKKAPEFDPKKSIKELLTTVQAPAVQNNGGGYYNHTQFWLMLTPKSKKKPSGELLKAIESKYKTFEDFQKEFTQAGLTQFGSGWAWLVKKKSGLEIIKKPNQMHPDLQEATPILGLDVWEHAYYLKNQNRRADYIKSFWEVVNWDYAAQQFLLK